MVTARAAETLYSMAIAVTTIKAVTTAAGIADVEVS
jgi:hypothetical protein